MTTMKPSLIAVFAVLAGSVATMTACHEDRASKEGARVTEASTAQSLTDFICDGTRYCDDFDFREPVSFRGSSIGITDCKTKYRSVLFGFWFIADAAARPFDWSAEVRYGGVFPVLGHVATALGCGHENPQAVSPETNVALDPDAFAWAKLEGDDVFIPFLGDATINHESRARATLQDPINGAAPRVTIGVKDLHLPETWYEYLAIGDSFAWDGYRAAVVRIVAPQEGVLGPIGWVEIRLSSDKVTGDKP